MTRAGWKRLLGAALVVAAFFFLGREIVRNAEQLRGFDWEVRPGLLVLSVAVLSLVFLAGTWVWSLVLRAFGVRMPLRPLARAWFLSNLSRYVPGVVWQFVSLVQLSGGAGLTAGTAVTSLLVHLGFSLLSAVVVGVWLLPLDLAGALAPAVVAGRWASPAALLLVHPALIRRSVRLAHRLGRGSGEEWEGSWPAGIGFLALGGLGWIGTGAAFHLFLLSFADVGIDAFPAVVAINALAFVVGYAAFFAPGGIGFKEAALTLLLGGLVPPAVAASLAIAARLWTIAAEVGPALVLARGGPGPAATKPPDPSRAERG